MLRVTFEILPGGDEARARTIGKMELANIKTHLDGTADYAVALKKPPPLAGALRAAWKKNRVSYDDHELNDVIASEDEELITAFVGGHHRTKRGVYDLLFRALRACGLDMRNRDGTAATLRRLVRIDYTNWRGERAKRLIEPLGLTFGASEFHPQPQYLIPAIDHEKKAERVFAAKDIHSWETP